MIKGTSSIDPSEQVTVTETASIPSTSICGVCNVGVGHGSASTVTQEPPQASVIVCPGTSAFKEGFSGFSAGASSSDNSSSLLKVLVVNDPPGSDSDATSLKWTATSKPRTTAELEWPQAILNSRLQGMQHAKQDQLKCFFSILGKPMEMLEGLERERHNDLGSRFDGLITRARLRGLINEKLDEPFARAKVGLMYFPCAGGESVCVTFGNLPKSQDISLARLKSESKDMVKGWLRCLSGQYDYDTPEDDLLLSEAITLLKKAVEDECKESLEKFAVHIGDVATMGPLVFKSPPEPPPKPSFFIDELLKK
ncbi:hypothetical protein NUH87_30840 [Pseudomonas batumici]|uniref:hypothetical protein n=1 Tax=Pseudomonas batumici TaxID=226910 RepID=UPI0030D380EB